MMSPPGRRRDNMLSLPAVILSLLFVFTTTASAASSVLGLDFGTLNLKAALVKPGIPLEIVLTKDSKRKESAAVAFKPTRDGSNKIIAELGSFPERAYGGDALSLQGRMPAEVFPNLKPLLGLPGTDGGSAVVEGYRGRYPAVQAQQVQELGTTMFKSSAFHESETPWSVEELLAMEIANIRHNAEAMAGKGQSVEDVVVTVPAFYTADERRAIERAAQLAGLEVNALISDGLAVGLDYAKSRTFPDVSKGEKPEYHMVFDMGAGSTTATLMRFQGKSVKDVGRFNKTVQEVAVMGTGWDRTLGGDSFNQVILDDYVQKFLTKPVAKSRGMNAEELTGNGRVMSRLWKEVEKARQVLSANSDTYSSFEELMPEIDFKTKLTRADFEKLCEPYVARVAAPVKDALTAAKMTLDDVDSIILHGGAMRTPFVQKQLEEFAGGNKKMRSNVNPDESAVFGAAFKGAGLSPSFKVKEIRNSDVAGYPAGMMYTDGGKERKQQLFSASSPVGNGAATKQVTFKDKEDFAFGLYQDINTVDRPITKIQTDNLTASVAELKKEFGCEKEDVTTKFSIRLSAVDGVPEIVGGTVSCEVEGSGKGGSVGDTVKDWFGFGGKKDQEALNEGEDEGPIEEVEAASSASSADSESATASSEGATSSASKAPEKPKKRTEGIPIAFSTSAQGNPQPAPEEMKRMRDRLAAFDRSDRARFAREEALNVLESYTYFVRDFLTNSDYEAFSTDAIRSEIGKLLESTRSFMEDQGQVAKATEQTLREKLKELKGYVEPIQTRRKEDVARPESVQKLKESLSQTNKMMDMVREQIAKASESASKAAESATESASSATASASSAGDFDGLEEPDSSSSTTTSEKPKATEGVPYSEADLKSLEEVYETISSWLSEKEVEQGKLQPFEDPVLAVRELEAQASKLSNVMSDLIYKKMRQQPKSTSSKKPKSSKTKAAKKSSKTASSSSATASPEAEESETASGKPRVVTMKPGGEMPSEEEILEMVGEARGEEDGSHDEL